MRHPRFPFRMFSWCSEAEAYRSDCYVGISAGYNSLTYISGLVALHTLEVSPHHSGLNAEEAFVESALGVLYDSMGYPHPWEYAYAASLLSSSDVLAVDFYAPVPGNTMWLGGVTGSFTAHRPLVLSTHYAKTLEFDPPLIFPVYAHDTDGAFSAVSLKLPDTFANGFITTFVFGYEQLFAQDLG